MTITPEFVTASCVVVVEIDGGVVGMTRGGWANLEASVRSRDTDDAKHLDRDLIEAGLN